MKKNTTYTPKDKHIYRQTDRQTERQIDRQIDKQTDRQTYRYRQIDTDRKTDRQIDRQTDRQTGRQTDRENRSYLYISTMVSVISSLNSLDEGAVGRRSFIKDSKFRNTFRDFRADRRNPCSHHKR